MQLAVDEINAAGGVDGRPLELSVIDDQNNVEEGVSGTERLIEDGAVAIGGVISSDVGPAAAGVAEELHVPLFTVKSGTPALLTQDSRYTFRSCLPAAPMVAAPIAQYIQEEGITRVGAIIADYAWGQTFAPPSRRRSVRSRGSSCRSRSPLPLRRSRTSPPTCAASRGSTQK